MKKIIIMLSLLTLNLVAQDSKIKNEKQIVFLMPFYGTINFDKNEKKTIKEKSTIIGTYLSLGTLKYLFEANYSNLSIKYKNPEIENLEQDDLTISYSRYYNNFMWKVGNHYINTNDKQLGNGNIIISKIEGYKYIGSSKYSIGIENYYSFYKKGHDMKYNKEKAINIYQFTPYLNFYNKINSKLTNTFIVKYNHEITKDYKSSSFDSYEISNTLGYKNFYTTIKYFDGKMKTGIKNGGFTVLNTLDLIKDSYSLKMGYYITEDVNFDITYSKVKQKEYDQLINGLKEQSQNEMMVFSLGYKF